MVHDITEQLIPIKGKIDQLADLVNKSAPTTNVKVESDEAEHELKCEPDLKQFGPNVQHFVLAYMDEQVRKTNIDTTFGIRYENGAWKIGNKKLE